MAALVKDRATVKSILDSAYKMLIAKPKPKERPNIQRLTTTGLWAKPFHSEALGVGPDQVEEAREEFRKHGLYIDFDKEGRAIFTGPDQYKRACKALGMFNGRDGYGVPNEDGTLGLTGRRLVEEREDFKRRLASGEYGEL